MGINQMSNQMDKYMEPTNEQPIEPLPEILIKIYKFIYLNYYNHIISSYGNKAKQKTPL